MFHTVSNSYDYRYGKHMLTTTGLNKLTVLKIKNI